MKHNEEGCWARRRQGGALLKLLLFLVVFSGVLTAAWIYFLPTILTSTLQKRTGFNVKVTSLRFNPFTAKVDLVGFVLSNPKSFPQPEFIEVRTFEANAKMKTLFSSRPEFDYARVDVAYVALVRSADGVLNAQLFHDRLSPPPPLTPEEIEAKAKEEELAKHQPPPNKVIRDGVEITIQNEKKPTPKEKSAKDVDADGDIKKSKGTEEAKEEEPMKYLIRRLEVRLEKIIIADYTVSPASIREFNFKMFYTYNDVTDPKQLLTPFAFKSLESVGAAIRGLIPGDIGRAMDATTKTKDRLFDSKEKKPGEDTLKTVVEKLEENQKP